MQISLKINKYLNSLFPYTVSHAILVHSILFRAVFGFYENFLLVILCKYNLGLIRFAVAKWFFCGLLFLCTIEVAYGFIHIIRNFYSIEVPTTLFVEPAFPKDLHVLKYKTVDSINTIEAVETDKIVKKPYCVYMCAFLVLYWGMCVAGSGA